MQNHLNNSEQLVDSESFNSESDFQRKWQKEFGKTSSIAFNSIKKRTFYLESIVPSSFPLSLLDSVVGIDPGRK